MRLSLLVVAVGKIVRSDVSQVVESDASLAADAEESSSKMLCQKNLYVTYKGDYQERRRDLQEQSAEGFWRVDAFQWESVKIATKKSREDINGKQEECTRSYTARCQDGRMVVKKTCETTCLGEDECVDERKLSGLFASAGTDLRLGDGAGEDDYEGEYALEIYDPEWKNHRVYNRQTQKWVPPEGDFGTLTRDTRVSWSVSDSDRGVSLSPIPRLRGTWSAPTGCYCCKHSYNFATNPFANMNGAHRQAWDSEECLLAWTELPQDSMWDILPRVIAMIIDRFTLTIGSHTICRATCAGVSSDNPLHTHSYMKFSESYY